MPPPPEFDRFASTYDAALSRGLALSGEDMDFFARGRVNWTKDRLTRLGFSPASVLDFGCGVGSTAPLLRTAFPGVTYLGVDSSTASLRLATEHFSSGFVSFKPAEEVRDQAFCDLVYCNGVFHHIPKSQQPAAAALVYRALKPGGYFAFWDNNPWSPAARLVMRRISFDRDAVMVWPAQARRLLRAAGFTAAATTFLFIFPSLLRSLRRWEPRMSAWPLGAQYLVLARKPGA